MFRLRTVLPVVVLFCGLGTLRAAEDRAPVRRILIVAGPKSHGPEGNRIHDYGWSARLIQAMLERSNVRDRVSVAVQLNGWPEDSKSLESADSLMVISDGRDGDKFSEALHLASPERVDFIERQMQRGCGLVAFHFSTFAPDQYAERVLDWTGGYFDWETDGVRKWYSAITTADADVQLASLQHPVLRGVRPFHLREEFYYNIRFDQNHAATPLLSVPALNGRAPDGNVVAWARERANGGRGFATTCGHFYDNWQNADFRKTVLNGIAWSAHVEVPEGGVEAPYLERDEIIAAAEAKATASADPRRAIDDPKLRASWPEALEIPAARPEDLTSAVASPRQFAPADWHRSHGDNASSRCSPLAQINRDNVRKLEVAWTYRSGDGVGNIQCNPVIVDGVMYAPTVGENVVAVDAATGRELWRFKPGGRPAHRGLVYWRGKAGEGDRLIFTAGKALHALDPKTGQPIPSFGEGGRVAASIATAGPAIFEHVIVVPGFDRDVFGYDLLTGQLLWTFHTVPQPGEEGAETWDKFEIGANCWGGMALDESRGIAYVATGSPKPNFVGTGHLGSNLFANCVIAIDARTGKRLWHFQELRHDIWDLDIPAPPVLVTVDHGGRKVDAVAQVTKIGNTLLLDRVTGKPLFPVPLRRAPVSLLPGERTWPYQPAIQLPEPFARQSFSAADITELSPEANAYIKGRTASAKHGWFETFEEGRPTVLTNIHGGAEWTGAAFDRDTGLLYVSANELPWIITVFRLDEAPRDPNQPPTPGEQVYLQNCAPCHGPDRKGAGVAPPLQGLRHRMTDAQVIQLLKTGRNLMPPAPQLNDDQRKLLLDFLFLRDRPQAAEPADPKAPLRFAFSGFQKLLDQEGYPGCKPPWGTLNAIDLNTGRIAWKTPLGEYPELTKRGIPKTGTENFGGAIVTAGGLVFCGGTRDLKIRAFDKSTGEELWSHELPYGGFAPPATYQVNGRQFVVIPATGGGKLGGITGDAYVAFALPEEPARVSAVGAQK